MKTTVAALLALFFTRWARLCCAIGLLLGTAVVTHANPLPIGPAAPSLAQALNPDGTLRAGAQGSFDARQYRLDAGPDGRPVFRPASTQVAGDEYWQPGFGLAGTNGAVLAVAQVGNTLYIGGQFTAVGNVKARNIAKWDGTRWSSLGIGAANGVVNTQDSNPANEKVTSMAVVGTSLYVAGSFTSAGGGSWTGRLGDIAVWDGSQWQGASAVSAPPVGARALTASGNDLYAGSSGGVARWNGSTWTRLAAALGPFDTIDAMAVVGNTLYVGGEFQQINGVSASGLARYDGSVWSTVGSHPAFTYGRLTGVLALAAMGTDLYVGGRFSLNGGPQNIYKWNGSSWSTLGTGQTNGVNDAVYALANLGGELYVGGDFTQAGNVPVDKVAKWNGSTWTRLAVGNDNGVNGRVNVLAPGLGGGVYAGGYFDQAANQVAGGFAYWNNNVWNCPGSTAANSKGIRGSLRCVVVAGTDVYVGGSFRQAGLVRANNVAKWDGSSWSSLGMGADNGVISAGGTGSYVSGLVVSGSTVYVGGYFSQAGSVAAHSIAKWDGTTWSALGSGANEGINNEVYCLALSGSDLYVAGRFGQAGGAPAHFIARWNGNAWSTLGTGSSEGTNSAISALAVVGNSLYVGGEFWEAGGQPANKVARWDGATWSSLGSGISGRPGLYPQVYALEAVGSDLYVGGHFAQAGSVPANSLAKWDGSSWSAVGSGVGNQVNPDWAEVTALAAAGGALYVGGSFTDANGVPARHLARWDGSTWSSLGSGTDTGVAAVAVSGPRVYVGGDFDAVGDASKVMSSFGIYDLTMPTATAASSVTDAALYPNPARQQVTLYLPALALARPVQLLDAQGRVVRQEWLASGAPSITISVSQLPAGVYLLRCGEVVRRVVVQ